ncbi:hypothetical protein FHR22_001129 [Sphingopyxis panaciterrae]|uniref:hypothetical protein n=1 Tax=Sphingopyxis panaciterrae TaxID=363841 RepID=UPI00141FF84F|nr:hypothetical protein [Sphingopyxis panaciterrae]NIJ36480.1 hypothetical protein [Sphingopyxis panaciterrae]
MTIRNRSTLCSALAAATLLLAGCGSKSDSEVASGTYIDPETGKSADYSVRSGKDGENDQVTIKTDDGEVRFGGEAKLPAGLTPFPGSKMTGGFAGASEGKQGGMASFEVKGKAADVVAHYRRQIEAAGLKVKSEMTAEDTIIISAEKPEDTKTSIQVTATQTGDMVEGVVTYGSGG